MENVNLVAWLVGVALYLGTLILDKVGDAKRSGSKRQLCYYGLAVLCGLLSGLVQVHAVWAFSGKEFAFALVLSMIATGFCAPLSAAVIWALLKGNARVVAPLR